MECVVCRQYISGPSTRCLRCRAAAGPAPMVRFWAQQSTRAKVQRQPHDYYFNYSHPLTPKPTGVLAWPCRAVRQLAGALWRAVGCE